MSQTTRCPACQTLFKVVPDQLRVSEGWVRCGQCSEIFDAALHLHQEPQIASQVEKIPATGTGVVSVASEPEVLAHPAAPPALPDPADTEIVTEKLVTQEESDVEPATEKLVAEELSAETRVAAQQVAVEATSVESEKAWVPVPSEVAPVSFLRNAPQKSVWRKPWVRGALGLTALGLVSALALQVIVQERDRIAASLPDARPALAAVCEILRCKISPLRQIESVVVDSSTFSKLRGDAFRLSFTVKNTSAIELAMPALELTLTDSQDQPALRRVFLPSEFGAPSNALAAGAEWVASVPIGVMPIAGAERITGYRVLAFYP